MKTTAIAPWFGGCRMRAGEYARQLGNLDWCGVPFCGGCPELPYINTRAGVAGDLHRHLINLVRVIRDADLKSEFLDRLDGLIFHPDELAQAQRLCVTKEADVAPFFSASAARAFDAPDVQWAAAYFVCAWMGRGGHAGKDSEFTQGLALRFTSSGGDSAKRFRSAIESVEAWHLSLRRWSFACEDGFGLIDRCIDEDGHGLYVDAPWPDAGEEYRHSFTERQHVKLRDALERLVHVRVVVRYGDHPMIRNLYRAPRWTWYGRLTRNQRNNNVTEVLIINGESYA